MRADDIVRQRFTKVFRGYDVQEVDVFLDEVIRTLDEMERERNVLLSRVEALLNELDRYDALLHNGAATSPADAGVFRPVRQAAPKPSIADISADKSIVVAKPADRPAVVGKPADKLSKPVERVPDVVAEPPAPLAGGFLHDNPLEEPPPLMPEPAEALPPQLQAGAGAEDEEIDLSAIFPEDYVQPDPSQESAAEPEPPEGQN